jgi:hypothetical protein
MSAISEFILSPSGLLSDCCTNQSRRDQENPSRVVSENNQLCLLGRNQSRFCVGIAA